MSQLRYWIWLTTVNGLANRAQLLLLDHFGSPEAVFLADHEAVRQVPGLTEREAASLEYRDLRRANQVLEDCRQKQINVLTLQDAGYPQRLRTIENPPLVLYYKGHLLPFDGLPTIAVVGSRKASPYGLSVAKRMGYQIGISGGVVVSGAARGIDSLALEGALSAGAPVAAVLGNGVDIVYPYEARRLYEDILGNGCILSEYVPGTPPLGANFPRRNRIMSGLSLGVLVVEAGRKSGSLITAELALEQGRDVYAVPGNVGLEVCAGSNQLLQEGAYLATCGWDVLQSYQALYPERLRRRGGGERLTLSMQDRKYVVPPEDELEKPSAKPTKTAPKSEPEPPNSEKRIDNEPKRNYIDLQRIMESLTQDEKTLVELLQQGETHVDDIIDQSGLPPARVLSSLTLLEVKGHVTQQPGKRFRLNLK
jgi:DNA processing protein